MTLFDRPGLRAWASVLLFSCGRAVCAQPETLAAPPMSAWEAQVTPAPLDDYKARVPAGVSVKALPGNAVRICYLIPSNRVAQTNAVAKLQYALLQWREFYREQMERNGFGSKTFAYETDVDGVTPKVWVVNAPNTDAYYRADPWSRVSPAAQAAGLPVWGSGNMWIEVYEAHVMNSDGSVTGPWNGGASFGSGSDGGVGMTCAYMLTLVTDSDLTDNRLYDNLTLPIIGPYPMKYGVTQANFDGNTVSSLSSVQHGVIFHEASHGFGLDHDFRHDGNFAGNLMGNGFRGVRGYLKSSLYPADELRASYASALVLNVNRYFNPSVTYTENTKPTLSVLTSGAVTPSTGSIGIRFQASDASGLAAMHLKLDGNVIGEAALSGTSVDQTITTPYFTPGTANSYAISVFDTQGNRQDASFSITPNSGFNRGPQPFVKIKPSSALTGASIQLDAGISSDPDGVSANMTVEWDLNGDGTFDTAPTTNKVHYTSYPTAGVRLVRCRLTDTAGGVSISTPIGVRTTNPPPASVPRELWETLD
ncbi:MAG: hypothetical protein K1X53_16565 [Candidatus Sumerlaeaceae bacterium]|nr:hypothetical protein [Candidatus Sumerlaeaceae bacterium]